MRATRSLDERVVYSVTRVIDDAGNTLGHCGFAGFHGAFYYQSRTIPVDTLFQRSLADDGARFDLSFDLLEDHDFFVNLAVRTPFRFVDEVTNIWHAGAGESGTGFGHNERPGTLEPYLEKLRAKWSGAFSRWTNTPETLLFLGQHNLRLGDTAHALLYLEQALKLLPDDINALNLCGMAHLQAGDATRAEALIGRALARLPDHAGLAANLALAREARSRAN